MITHNPASKHIDSHRESVDNPKPPLAAPDSEHPPTNWGGTVGRGTAKWPKAKKPACEKLQRGGARADCDS
jgi:hypothetical protein